MSDNAIILTGDSNEALAAARISFRSQLERAAEANTSYLADEGFQPLEIAAVRAVEQLRLLGGFELVTVLERGELFKKIEQEGLASVYPGEASTLEGICAEIGISKSEFSDTKSLCDVVFPWLIANTDKSLQEWWESIGKSKFRELLPVLRGLIEGESARNHESVNEAVRAQLESAAQGILAEAIITGGSEIPEDQAQLMIDGARDNGTLQHRAVLNVLEFGTLPVREMRQQVRPSRTPNIVGTMFRGNTSYVVLRMTGEQVEMFQRLMGTHADIATVNGQDHAEHIRYLGQVVPE